MVIYPSTPPLCGVDGFFYRHCGVVIRGLVALLLGGEAPMLLTIECFFDTLSRVLGRVLAIIYLLMTLNVFFDVVMRYFFHNSSVGMQEMEWHLFAIIILFGMSVALLEEGHVRVDFFYDHFPVRTKAVINIIGTVFFLLPLA